MKTSVKLFLVKFWPLIFFLGIIVFFFRPFIFEGKIPIPGDTIVGLYHPFRDLYAEDYPRGVPFKNFLITDPVRQQYPWRDLAIDSIKKGELPLWNPYSFSGTPLLGNLQSAAFYPLNFLFFIFPFKFSWGFLILLEPFLAGVFLYFYLRNLNLEKLSSLVGAVSFAFSGFSIAWMEWGTILHSALWLPLILLAIDKIFQTKKLLIWSFIFIFSLTASFFAGHLQTFFYIGIISVVYTAGRWRQYGKNTKAILLFIFYYLLTIGLVAIQWIPTFQFINLSGRGLDQIEWQKEGWFIPWQNLIQFLAPDFFGNPTTLNYWGVWNYAEFLGYVGILPFILAIYTLIWRQDRKTLFFGSIFFLSLIFALPTPLAKIPYQLQIPLLSTSQPTRLLFLTDFSLTVLAALGLDYFLKLLAKKQKISWKKSALMVGSVALMLILTFAGLWIFTLKGLSWFKEISAENLLIARRNLILPTVLFTISLTILFILPLTIKNKSTNGKALRIILFLGILLITSFDLLRFGQKFTPFIKDEWLFPKTKTIEFLQNQEKPFRIMATDSRILPPNFPLIYRLESVEGYDPLYLARYAEFIAASERKEPNISPPFGFNRIITPQNFDSKIIDLLNIKYILSLKDLSSPKLKKVLQEGETRVYENLNVLPRTFFVERVEQINDKESAIKLMFEKNFDPLKTAIIIDDYVRGLTISEKQNLDWWHQEQSVGSAKIIDYSANRVVIESKNTGRGFLVLADSFYPTWQAKIFNQDLPPLPSKDVAATRIYRTDYNLRGIVVPEGHHKIEFENRWY